MIRPIPAPQSTALFIRTRGSCLDCERWLGRVLCRGAGGWTTSEPGGGGYSGRGSLARKAREPYKSRVETCGKPPSMPETEVGIDDQ